MRKRSEPPSEKDTPHVYALQVVGLETLRAAARGEVDLNRMAREELASRGLDYFTGKWVGFERAAELVRTTGLAKDREGKPVRVSIPDDDPHGFCEVCEDALPTMIRAGLRVCGGCAETYDTDIAPATEEA